jgi:hypothetical protein
MRRSVVLVNGLAGIGCILGLLVAGPCRAPAQQPGPTPQRLQPPPADVLEEIQYNPGAPAVAGDSSTLSGTAQPSANEPKAAGPQSDMPPRRDLPLPGMWIVPPTGPGYYSLADVIHDNEREKAPFFPYSRVSPMINSFFDANFSYLDSPGNKQHDIFDCLHRIHCGDCWLFSTGGEERLRDMNEENSRLSGKDNHYLLERTRVYMDVSYSNWIRFFVEFIDARSTHQNLNPLPIDQNHGDLLNCFFDLRVLDLCDKPVWLRVGRQEMLLGSERLVSPLDWANTRRTFQGLTVWYNSDKLDFTTFAVQPVGIPNNTNAGANPDDFDSVNDEENFYGAWTTFHPSKKEVIDLYWLDYNNANANAAVGANGVMGAFNIYTVGSRYAGEYKHFLWDFEGMYQWGHWSTNQEVSAAAYTTALGYNLPKACWNPTFWVSWDWASGNHNPNGPEHGTFNQLFPFNHYYFGQIDLIGRQNIEDFNMQLSLWPEKWWLVNLQYHALWLESPKDALYSPSGAVERVSPTGTAGRSVGNLFTITTNFHIDAHQDILLGYSKLAVLDFIRNTGPAAAPELYYVQYTFRW